MKFGQLKDYQISHAERLIEFLKKRSAVLDGSDAGTGKTYVAAHIARQLNLIPVVVCPKNVRDEWESVLTEFGHARAYVSNYDQYKNFNNDDYVIATKKKRHPYKWITGKKHLIIFDEVHVCKDPSSFNSKLLLATKLTESRVMMLSATVADNPLHLEAAGVILNMFRERTGYMDYCFSRGVIRNPSGFGLLFRGSKNDLKKIHSDLYSRKGARMDKTRIPGFPEEQTIPKLYSIKDKGKIDSLYNEVREITDRIEQMRESDKSNVLTERLRARQEIEAIRLPIIIEETFAEIDQGKSVVVFCNFKESINFLMKKLIKLGPVCIHGDLKDSDRQEAKRKFQADISRVIIVQTQAGVGIGLHDTHGNHPRVSFICPNDSAILLIQNIGRTPRSGAKTLSINYLVYIAGTVEEKVYKNVKNKIDRIKTINDGDLRA